MKVNIFNKEITLRNHYCQFFSEKPSPIKSPYINLYVRFKGCNANCLFCEYKNTANKFNLKKYEKILKELNSKLEVRKIAITGGEPTLNYNLYKDAFNMSYEYSPDAIHAVNTNGINLEKMFNDTDLINKLTDLTISRHHYNEKLNNELLGFKSASNDMIRDFKLTNDNVSLINFSCNLIKGYIDNIDEIIKFLEFVSSINVYRVGLVSLMPINDYCKDNFININKVELPEGKFYRTKKWTNRDACECYNYLYMQEKFDKEFVKIYFKNTYGILKLTNTLIFDGDNLLYGFNDDIIC